MIDARLRRYIDPPLDRVAHWISHTPITANRVTIAGFVIGMLAVPLLALHEYLPALLVIACNRLADGLDGAIARQTQVSEPGAYLDIVSDFIFYAATVFGFCLARPSEAVYGAFLIFSFFASGVTFLSFAIFAARHNITTEIRGKKSIYYLGGLAEGTETIIAFILMCLWPDTFIAVTLIFGCMCWITGLARVRWAIKTLGSDIQSP